MIPQEEFRELYDELMREASAAGRIRVFQCVRSGQQLSLVAAWRLAGEITAAWQSFLQGVLAVGRV